MKCPFTVLSTRFLFFWMLPCDSKLFPVSCQLVDIFNILFTSGVSPSALKIAKVVSVHKKDSKLDQL